MVYAVVHGHNGKPHIVVNTRRPSDNGNLNNHVTLRELDMAHKLLSMKLIWQLGCKMCMVTFMKNGIRHHALRVGTDPVCWASNR